MEFELKQARAILQRTPAVLEAMLRSLPVEWTAAEPGVDDWSPFDVLGHLIHGEETDWIPRARIILTEGEARVFDVFDRNAQFAVSAGKSLDELLDTFFRLRAENLAVLDGWQLTPEQLQKTGRHPELGRVTLGQHLATWTAHDLNHIEQISRVMCQRYRNAVGPWRAYLRLLQ